MLVVKKTYSYPGKPTCFSWRFAACGNTDLQADPLSGAPRRRLVAVANVRVRMVDRVRSQPLVPVAPHLQPLHRQLLLHLLALHARALACRRLYEAHAKFRDVPSMKTRP